MRMPSVTRLRSRRLSPSRVHSLPKTFSRPMFHQFWCEAVDVAIGHRYSRKQFLEDPQAVLA
jgi:hypothetical protein